MNMIAKVRKGMLMKVRNKDQKTDEIVDRWTLKATVTRGQHHYP